MNSFEWNKIIGAVLGTAIFIFVVRLVAETVYEPAIPAKPGYVVEGVVETPAPSAAAATVADVMPDWGTVLASADVAAGKTISTKCEQCHDLSKGGPNKIGPNLYEVVGRVRASHPGFDYSSAIKAMPGNWTFDELFKFLKGPQAYIVGTKMSFAGLKSETDRINLIAYLRTNADSPVAIPAPAPKSAAPAAAPAGAAPAGAAPADAAKAATAPSTSPATDKPQTPAASSPAASSAAPAPASKSASQPAGASAADTSKPVAPKP